MSFMAGFSEHVELQPAMFYLNIIWKFYWEKH
jgi:hypothetical protein